MLAVQILTLYFKRMQVSFCTVSLHYVSVCKTFCLAESKDNNRYNKDALWDPYEDVWTLFGLIDLTAAWISYTGKLDFL